MLGSFCSPDVILLPSRRLTDLCGVCHSYRLFSQRQRAGATQEWNDKLPDFVRRLEEALYRTARSKVLPAGPEIRLLLNQGFRQADRPCFLQEEYVDTTTLEGRLQDVARRMVSTQGGRRSDPGRPPAGPSLPQANGFPGSGAAGAPAYGAGAGFGSGGQINQLLTQPGRSLQPAGSLPDSASLQQAPGPVAIAGAAAAFPGANGATAGLPGRGAASPQLSNGPVSSPAAPKPEPSLSNMQAGPQFGARPAGMQPAASLHQTPALGPSGQSMMSNGAPVLLRGGARDWGTSGASPSLVNVRVLTAVWQIVAQTPSLSTQIFH